MLRYFHGMSCQLILSEMPILLPRSIILAPSLTLPSPKTVSCLMKPNGLHSTVSPVVKVLVSQVFCHETSEHLPLLFIYSLHAFQSAEQVHCSRHSMAASPMPAQRGHQTSQWWC